MEVTPVKLLIWLKKKCWAGNKRRSGKEKVKVKRKIIIYVHTKLYGTRRSELFTEEKVHGHHRQKFIFSHLGRYFLLYTKHKINSKHNICGVEVYFIFRRENLYLYKDKIHDKPKQTSHDKRKKGLKKSWNNKLVTLSKERELKSLFLSDLGKSGLV